MKIRGLYTHPSDLDAVPDGALAVADNVVIDKEGKVNPRRGFDKHSELPSSTDRADKLFTYQDKILASYTGGKLGYYNSGWNAYTGTFNAPTGEKIRSTKANSNFYFTTSDGVKKLDEYSTDPSFVGSPRALDGEASLSGSSGFMTNDTQVAYRVVWGYRDENDNLILGSPSQRILISNSTGGTRDVDLTITIPDSVTTDWFFQVYRSPLSSSASTEPTDELGLVYEANPTSGEISSLSLTFTDNTPESLRGADLYTNDSQEGLLQSNTQPPLAHDVATFKNVTFYANTTSKHRIFIDMLAVGGDSGVSYVSFTGDTTSGSDTIANASSTTGLEIGQTITGSGIPADTTITNISGTDVTISNNATATDTTVSLEAYDVLTIAGVEYYAANGESVANKEFEVVTGGTPSQNIADTARSLIRVINQSSSTTDVYAYYLSGVDDLPGKMLIEERGVGGSTFTISSSAHGATAWNPGIASAYSSVNDRYRNGLFFSKIKQPESVPLLNFQNIGSASDNILRIAALRDSLFIFKEDGIYRLVGESPESFIVDLFDSSTKLIAPETVRVLNNQIYALTDQGVVSVSESGVQVLSRPIEKTLLELRGANQTYFESESFAVSYESDRKYILSTVSSSADTSPTQMFVWNTFTSSWTRWDIARTAGVVNPDNDKLYFTDSNSDKVYEERKAFNNTDYVDEAFDVTISSYSGTEVTLATTTGINAGDILFESSSKYSLVLSVDSATQITVYDEVAWTLGSASILSSFECLVEWVPFTGQNPGVLKQFSEIISLFDIANFNEASVRFYSDLSGAVEGVTMTGNFGAGWGLFAWGGIPWGGNALRSKPIRTYIPREKQKCSQLSVQFRIKEGYGQFELQGLHLTVRPISNRVLR